MVRAHWMLAVAERAGLRCAGEDVIEPGIPVVDAWARMEERCGVSEDDLARYIATHFRLAVADLDSGAPQALKLVPERVARRYHVFPIREDDRQLVVATSDPTNIEIEQALGFASGRTPQFEVAGPSAIAEAIGRKYSSARAVESLLGILEKAAGSGLSVVEEAEAEALSVHEIEAGPVVKLTNLILQEAIEQGASDVHVEPGRSGGAVRFRVDGVLRQFMPMSMTALNRVVSRIKILGKIDIADRVRPQDGRARIRLHDHAYDLRISTVPTRDSEKAVIRILDPDGARGLDQIGLPDRELKRLRRLLSHRDGIVVVTGPTGSGKTTTLYGALAELETGEVNIMTVEDPVEYELPGITQIQVEPRRGVTFASALKAILRQDPDVILVGEIRDLQTADVALQASLTGHLVLATLHTNDAVGAVTRLHDLGLDRAAVSESLRGVVAQRLARRLCTHCARPVDRAELPEQEARLAAQYGVEPIMQAAGCDRCGGTGYRGRYALMEIATVTANLAEQIAKGASFRELTKAAVAGGMRPMREAALERVRDGTTTLTEIDRVFGESVEEVAEGEAATPHVLLVDDDPVTRALARKLLESNDLRVSEVGDGAAAMERLGERQQYDLLVLDLDMPKLGGREVLRRVRNSVATAGLPVVILTGSEDHEAEAQLMEEGADDYIRKPIDPPRFIARIKAALRRVGS